MGTFQTAIKKAELLTPLKASRDLFIFIKSIEDEVFDLNIKQIQNAENSEGKPLINSDSKFTGVYSKATEAFAELENPVLPKKEGKLYNFGWTGDFLGNFQMDVFPDYVAVYSTGDGGNNEKQAFFDGYKSIYGLSPKSIAIIIEKRILPYLQDYYVKGLIG